MVDGVSTGTPPDSAAPYTAVTHRPPFGAKHALLVFAAHIGSQLAASVLVMFAVGLYGGLRSRQLGLSAEQMTTYVARLVEDVGLPLAIAFALLVSIVVLLAVSQLLIRREPHPTYAEAVGWRMGTRRQMWQGAALGVTLGFAYLIVAALIFPLPDDAELGPLAQMAMRGGLYRLLWGVLAIAVAPPLEEFLYRGVLYTGIARSWGPRAGAFVTILVFTALHLGEVRYYWPALPFVAVLAVTVQVVRMRTDSVAPGVALHAAYNGVLVVLSSILT